MPGKLATMNYYRMMDVKLEDMMNQLPHYVNANKSIMSKYNLKKAAKKQTRFKPAARL